MKSKLILILTWLLTKRITIERTENGSIIDYEFRLKLRKFHMIWLLTFGWFLFGIIGTFYAINKLFFSEIGTIESYAILDINEKLRWYHGRQ